MLNVRLTLKASAHPTESRLAQMETFSTRGRLANQRQLGLAKYLLSSACSQKGQFLLIASLLRCAFFIFYFIYGRRVQEIRAWLKYATCAHVPSIYLQHLEKDKSGLESE